jgi:2-(1,2-epoxy-1,2-dihydrophenyl)acetyl-CoA isomerase
MVDALVGALTEAATGSSPDSGSTWLLPRLVGLARAKRMLLLGEKVTGCDAAQWGLIHDAVDPSGLDQAVDDLLTRLADATLPQTMNQELFNLELSCRTTDFKEGLSAFRERRTPEFGGR